MDATLIARTLLDAVPAHRTAGIEVVRAVDGDARTALTTSPTLTDVVGSLHASVLVTLLDGTGLAAVISACTGEEQARSLLPLGTSATLDFRRPARGRLTGQCTLEDPARIALDELLLGRCTRARLGTTTEILDGHGDVVCSGTFRWNVRTLQPA